MNECNCQGKEAKRLQTEASEKTNKNQHFDQSNSKLAAWRKKDGVFDKMWLGTKPKHVALEDCEGTASEDECPMEDEEAEENEKEQFLAEIGAASSSKPKKDLACKKSQRESSCQLPKQKKNKKGARKRQTKKKHLE